MHEYSVIDAQMNRLRHTARVTVDELQWFVVLAETEHMTEAAERLNLAQPTLSRSLARLERRLGAPLFDRTGRRLRLNRYGAVLLEHARRGLAELATAQERIDGLRDPDRGTVRLAFLHSVATWLVPELLRSYRAEFPEVRFELRQAPGHELLALLEEGHVDLVVTSPRPAGVGPGWHPLHRERLCLAVPAGHPRAGHPLAGRPLAGHPLAGRRRCRLAEVADETFVVLQRGFGLRELTDELCDRAGFTPTAAFESTEIPSMEGLVGAGLGLAVVPEPRAGRATPGVAYVQLADPGAHRTIGLLWRPDRPMPPVSARFGEFVRAHDW
jgi:DNA-binding transcriptional LysR family regulator